MKSIRLDITGAKQLARSLTGMVSGVTKAEDRAVRRTTAWAYGQITRSVAKDIGVPMFAIRRVARYRFERKSRLGMITSPTAGMPVHYMAKSEDVLTAQMRRSPEFFTKNHLPRAGVKVAGWRFAGAFVARNWNNKYQKNNDYAVWERKDKRRMPIRHVRIEIKPQMMAAFDEVRPRVGDEMRKRLMRELNFVLNVEGKK